MNRLNISSHNRTSLISLGFLPPYFFAPTAHEPEQKEKQFPQNRPSHDRRVIDIYLRSLLLNTPHILQIFGWYSRSCWNHLNRTDIKLESKALSPLAENGVQWQALGGRLFSRWTFRAQALCPLENQTRAQTPAHGILYRGKCAQRSTQTEADIQSRTLRVHNKTPTELFVNEWDWMERDVNEEFAMGLCVHAHAHTRPFHRARNE